MHIKGRDSSFKLKVLGYEFQNSTDTDDSNWLSVRIDCTDNTNKWSASGGFLRTMELIEIQEWLSSINDADSPLNRLSFTEHEIAFEYLDDGRLVVCLDYDCHPKGVNYNLNDDTEYQMYFTCNNKALKRLIADIDTALKMYPVRNLSH
jgi:hypothetical protein